MKRVLAAFAAFVLASLLLIPMQVKAEDHPDRLIDEADILTSSEEQEIRSQLNEISNRLNIDVAICMADPSTVGDIEDYADDFYDYCGYGMGNDRSGILLVIAGSDCYVSTRGVAEDRITNDALSDISQAFRSEYNSGNYAKAMKAFAREAESHLVKKFPWVKNILISLGIALLLALIITSVMRSKLKSVRPNNMASDYVVPGSLNVKQAYEIFLYSKVHSVRRSDNNNGGNNSHISSSGASHGGGRI